MERQFRMGVKVLRLGFQDKKEDSLSIHSVS